MVFNTEAHAFPRFELGKLFKTGWKRKGRGSNGNVVDEPRSEPATTAEPSKVEDAPVEIRTIHVAATANAGDNAATADHPVAQGDQPIAEHVSGETLPVMPKAAVALKEKDV